MIANQGRRRRLWIPEEDQLLSNYVQQYGAHQWEAVALNSGLVDRDANSCWLRWFYHLSPDIQRGDFTADEVNKIVELHQQWGNSWSRIARQLPGRTANQIKNFWYTSVNKQPKMLNCDAEQKPEEMIQVGVVAGDNGSTATIEADIAATAVAPLHLSEMWDNVPDQDHYLVALASDNCYKDLPNVKGFDNFCNFNGML